MDPVITIDPDAEPVLRITVSADGTKAAAELGGLTVEYDPHNGTAAVHEAAAKYLANQGMEVIHLKPEPAKPAKPAKADKPAPAPAPAAPKDEKPVKDEAPATHADKPAGKPPK